MFRFDGGAATFVGTALLGLLITVVTLGICYPFALVLMERWRAKHTTVDGDRLKFVGSATGLFGRWLLWLLLIIVTLGIYSFWVVPRITRWRVEHRVYEADGVRGRFRFDGGAGTFWGTALLGLLLTVLTVGIMFRSPWCCSSVGRPSTRTSTGASSHSQGAPSGSSAAGCCGSCSPSSRSGSTCSGSSPGSPSGKSNTRRSATEERSYADQPGVQSIGMTKNRAPSGSGLSWRARCAPRLRLLAGST